MSAKRSARGNIALIISRLKRRYKREMRTSLNYNSSWELLVATILSAQSQDAQVNRVTRKMFAKLKSIGDYARMKPQQLYPYTKRLGLYKTKSRYIVGTAQAIEIGYGGTVPSTIRELTSLPGVGRKTANVVLANAFHKHEGIAVDTHCITVCKRLFLLKTANPVKIEQMLMKLVPKEDWGNITHLFIALGRDVCTARAKHCERCVLADKCPSSTVDNPRSHG